MSDSPTQEELLQKFRELSIQHYAASEQGDYETVNRGVSAVEQIIRELWVRGGRTKDALKPLSQLAKDSDPRVAIKAVIYTVELYPEVADELQRLQRDKGLVGLAAQHAIRNVKSGNVGWLSEVLKS